MTGESDGAFFGQHIFPNHGGRVVITEGELDAASCFQAMPGWTDGILTHWGSIGKESYPEEPSTGFKATMRYVSSLITTTLDTELHKRQHQSYHQVRLLLLTFP